MIKKFTIFFFCFFLVINSYSQEKTNKVYKKFYHPNGTVSSEGYLVNGEPDGFWISYYVTGVKMSEGNRYKHKLDSVWVFYNNFGDTIEKISYKYGIKNGYNITYKRNSDLNTSVVVSKELYVNNIKEGTAQYYYNDGKIYRISNFSNGKKDGYEYMFAEDGRIVTVNTFLKGNLTNRERINRYDENNLKHGVWIKFYPDYKVKTETSYDHGKRNGLYKSFNDKGGLMYSVLYQNDEVVVNDKSEDNKVIIKNEYNQDSVLVATGAFLQNKPVGIHRKFDSSGEVIDSKSYDELGVLVSSGIVTPNGLREGDWMFYYNSGNVQSKGKYVNGRKSGRWYYYFENGKIEQEGEFRNGLEDGSWTWYFDNGEIRKEELYYDGDEDGLSTEYDINGNVVARGNYIEGERDGKWFINSGDIIEKGSYINGLRDGIWIYTYMDDKQRFKGEYIQGNPNGKHIFLYHNGNIEEERYYNQGFKEKTWKKYDEQGNILITITYVDNREVKINGIKIDLPDDNIKRIR